MGDLKKPLSETQAAAKGKGLPPGMPGGANLKKGLTSDSMPVRMTGGKPAKESGGGAGRPAPLD